MEAEFESKSETQESYDPVEISLDRKRVEQKRNQKKKIFVFYLHYNILTVSSVVPLSSWLY